MYERAASQLQLLVQSTPWALTDNFVSAIRENRGSLALIGPGDPTARGDGFSYMKESVRVSLHPTDKNRVYAAIHPRDLSLFYFSSVFEETLRRMYS